MKAHEAGASWLRDKAAELRMSAARVESAYNAGKLRDTCLRVASAYREAAKVLDDQAVKLEAQP